MKLSKYAVVYLVLTAFSAAAQDVREVPLITCYGEESDAFTAIWANFDNSSARTVTTSTIEVTYAGFPADAKAAFQQAATIWETYLVSSQRIKINATWQSLTAGTLAQTGATKIYRNFPLAPAREVWYPAALAEAISGRNLNADEFEINVNVNSEVNWSYNLTAQPAAGRFDMVTVILHEIAHGLGINASASLTDDNLKGQWGQTLLPYAFDNYVENTQGNKITDTGIFGNPSVELKSEYTNNALVFTLSERIYQGRLPKLNAVSPFRAGGSISHLDEATYPAGTENSLMTPSVRSAEVNHRPGPLVLLMLNQLGWGIRNLPTFSGIITATEKETDELLVYPNPASESVTFVLPPNAEFARGYLVNMYNVKVRELTPASGRLSLNVSGMAGGWYVVVVENGSDKKLVKKFAVVR